MRLTCFFLRYNRNYKLEKEITVMRRVAVVAALFAAMNVMASAEDWVYVPAEGIISNSVWSIRVYESDATQKQLNIGKASGNTEVGNAFTGRGSGDLDLSTNVRKLLDDGTLEDGWSLVGFTKSAFSVSIATEQKITKFVIPTTTLSLADKLLFNEATGATSLTNVVLVAHACTGTIGDSAFRGNKSLKTITVDLPLVTGVGDQAFNCGWGSMDGVDYAEWNLPSVTLIESSAFSWTHGYGNLRLPALKTFNNSAVKILYTLEAIEIGTKYVPTNEVSLYVGTSALQENGSLGVLTIGPYSKFNFANDSAKANAFTKNPALTNITFTGTMLENTEDVLDALLYDKGEIKTNAMNKQLIVYAPRKFGWGKLADDASDEELVNKPSWIRDEDLMGVYKGKAWLVNKDAPTAYYTDDVTFGVSDPRFGDQIVDENGNPIKGPFEIGGTVTISAVCSQTTFVGWDGLPEGAVTNGLTATFVVEEGLNIVLRTAPNWTYLAEEGVISNKIWKVNVSTDNLNGNRLRIGDLDGTAGNAFTDLGEGILDMSGKVYTPDDVEWTITHFGRSAFSLTTSGVMKNTATEFVFPKTTKSIAAYLFHKEATDAECCLERVIMDVPEFDGSLGSEAFRGCNKLQYLYINAPKMTGIGSQALNNGTWNLANTDFTDWNLDSVTTIESQGLAWRMGTHGYLKLPSLRHVKGNGFRQNYATAFDIGSKIIPQDKVTLKLENQAFYQCEAATSVVFGAYIGITRLGSYPTNSITMKKLTDVRFLGAPPTMPLSLWIRCFLQEVFLKTVRSM